MLKKIWDNKSRSFLIVLLIAVLASIRSFEESLFYDPFLNFFKMEFAQLPLPKFDLLRLIISIAFRYFLNTTISLAIIYLIFKESDLVKFSTLLYLFFFVALIITFFSIIHISGSSNNLMLFYVRRFLIQPLFLILFIPAFYYQKFALKK